MFVSLSILLLLLFVLGFWIVSSSKASLWLKITSITLFFLFCVIMASTMDSSMGWAATKNIPKIVAIRHVTIKEPNPQLNFQGSIYLLLDVYSTKTDSALLNFFGHKMEGLEPKLFKIPYNRSLHEQLQKNVIPRLMKGQVVFGKFGSGSGGENGDGKNGSGNGKSGKGGGKGRGGRGNGSESIDPNDTMFYELPPSFFLEKH